MASPPPPSHIRADELLLSQGEVDSRAVAQRLIRAGKVLRSDGSVVNKPSQKLPEDERLIISEPIRFVSRGGDKLEAWFQAFPLDITEMNALDVGASTGGFTDCLLQRGAAHVTGIDVGHGQLHPRLDDDPRVVSLEGINARALDEVELPHETYPLVVADLSFISLKKVLTPVWNRVAPNGRIFLLVKPQFEAPKEIVTRTKGIIRDKAVRADALASVRDYALSLPGAILIGELECPIAGGDGNREYLIGLQKAAQPSD
ncbi:TlyA family RNA methyltransferase [Cerasicoccus arenae]|uniref:TlyA family rRNA (Cytidine-2'-O)-methyltransferase n=1 Tax=Cerasicoccus arenae TaxID=424488 RepID=A0A8J3GFG0_9BACT|nr:TlyA family RNA methyltransferase [Cerasicoccus arenae]MBK1856865.1 TlyA family RNA methyltransferase [Cerasicoccus arenae]GHC11367.1 TlyA family rRNA (cytidine-2'-O)-methyltransferase [Cerasicoccus arenae]